MRFLGIIDVVGEEKKGRENINLLLKQMWTDFDALFFSNFSLLPHFIFMGSNPRMFVYLASSNERTKRIDELMLLFQPRQKFKYLENLN